MRRRSEHLSFKESSIPDRRPEMKDFFCVNICRGAVSCLFLYSPVSLYVLWKATVPPGLCMGWRLYLTNQGGPWFSSIRCLFLSLILWFVLFLPCQLGFEVKCVWWSGLMVCQGTVVISVNKMARGSATFVAALLPSPRLLSLFSCAFSPASICIPPCFSMERHLTSSPWISLYHTLCMSLWTYLHLPPFVHVFSVSN